jgi:hypothetical protein
MNIGIHSVIEKRLGSLKKMGTLGKMSIIAAAVLVLAVSIYMLIGISPSAEFYADGSVIKVISVRVSSIG